MKLQNPFRLDVRSLALCRILLGIALLADGWRRLGGARDFYSNEGVLPNHAHLFQIKETGQVWSLMHAVSSVGEAWVVIGLAMLAYLALIIGAWTKTAEVVSLVAAVSFAGRNSLLTTGADGVRIALLAITLWLPMGQAWSVDALRRAFTKRREKTAIDLNRPWPRIPLSLVFGTAPTVFLFFVLAMIALEGSDVARGLAVAAAVAIVVPVGHVALRAAVALAFAALAGLAGYRSGDCAWGMALLAAGPLAFTHAFWEQWQMRLRERRGPVTIVYDVDCGVCLLTCQILKRLDVGGLLSFQGNDNLEAIDFDPGGPEAKRLESPAGLEQTVLETVVVVDRTGRAYLRAEALAEILLRLPCLTLAGHTLRLPLVRSIARVGYDAFAARREHVSVALGYGACGIEARQSSGPIIEPSLSPARMAERRFRYAGMAILGWVTLVALALAALSQRTEGRPFHPLASAIARWSRVESSPWPPAMDPGNLVVDGRTSGGQPVDPVRGGAPRFEAITTLGTLWDTYARRLALPENERFRRSFREYLIRGGREGGDRVVSFDAYWVTGPGEGDRIKFLSHGRGDRAASKRILPPVLQPRGAKDDDSDDR